MGRLIKKQTQMHNLKNDLTHSLQWIDHLTAEKYGTTYQKIATLNGIKNPNKIYAGQKPRVKELFTSYPIEKMQKKG